jgi:hypothetical protein
MDAPTPYAGGPGSLIWIPEGHSVLIFPPTPDAHKAIVEMLDEGEDG